MEIYLGCVVWAMDCRCTAGFGNPGHVFSLSLLSGLPFPSLLGVVNVREGM
jgi:hypothetical protein